MPAWHAHPLILARLLDELGGHDGASREAAEWLWRDPVLAAGLLDRPGAATAAALPEGLDGATLKRELVAAAASALGQWPADASMHDWRDTATCALACQGLAERLGYPDPRRAYLAGLLHNRCAEVGQLADAALADALLAQDEDLGRLAEALPLARLLRVARAAARDEGDAFRVAATLLPELPADDLDGLRRQAGATVAEWARRLAGPVEADPKERLSAALAEHLRVEAVAAELAEAQSEVALIEAAQALLARQLGLRQPLYLAHDRASDTLTPAPGSPHAGLRVRLPGSNSAAAWAMSSGQPVVFATGDAESVSLLDVQLARLAGAAAVVAIPVGERPPDGVLLGCVDQRQAADLERASAHLGRLGRVLGRALARVRSMPAQSPLDQFKAKARRAAHEINNPLGIVRNYLALLGARLEGQGTEELAIIRAELDRLPPLLLALTGDDDRPLPTRREDCDIGALARDQARVAESAVPAGRRIRIAARIEPNLPVIRSDAGKLRQMLLNLVLNAIDACPEEGLVAIDAYSSIDLRGARQVLIAVRDNGGGIAPDKLARLFEPTASTKGGQHAGLGLAIVKSLADELGMSVTCRSDAQGTTFQIAMTAV